MANIFQGMLDSRVSPLLTRPATLPAAPMPALGSLGGALKPLPLTTGAGSPDMLGGLLRTLGTAPAPPRTGGLLRRGQTPAARTRIPAKNIPASPDTTLRSRPGGSGWVSAVAQQARAAGVPPDLAVAIALEESGGDPRATGDAGSSYGLFQLHKGGALGNLTPEQAYDPATNAGVVLRAWGKLGQIPSDPRAALMQYYSQVGRGSSNEIPTQRALAKLAQARQLVGQGGGGGVGAPAGGRTLAQETVQNPVGGGLSPGALQGLIGYAMQLTQRAQQGQAPDPSEAMRLIGPLLQAMHRPTVEVASGQVPAADPGVTGKQSVATHAALQQLGVPYSWGGGTTAGPSLGIQQGARIRGFDCSSLVQYAWSKAGVMLPRTSEQQWNFGAAVPNLASAKAGDLLFPEPGHVMMYLGDGKAVESPHTGLEVRVVSVLGRQFQRIRRPG